MSKPEFFDERQGSDLASKITDAPVRAMSREEKRTWIDAALDEPGSRPRLLLDSQLDGHPASRYTLLADDPLVILSARGERLTLEWGSKLWKGTGDPWMALQKLRAVWPAWMTGYFGYDLKNRIEALHSRHPDPVGAPDLWFMIPGTLQVYDAGLERLSRLRQELPESSPPERLRESWNLEPVGAPSGDERRALVAGMSDAGQTFETPESASGRTTRTTGSATASDTARSSGLHPDPRTSPLASSVSEAAYLEAIRKAQEAIKEGEVYELNLSRQLSMPFASGSGALFRAMREAGPVPFASWIRTPEWSVSCASPERFLSHHDGRLFSQPIKGTAPRDADPVTDRALRDHLIESEKERAENVMITDLVRHDLSRVCEPGSVTVPRLFDVQSFRTVHQLITTVEGRVKSGTDPVEMIRACFPMGSMTGAPKIRSMEWIERLERYRRGIYSGAIGYIAPDGEFDFNVVIRTAILRPGTLWYAAGGAITSDSDPEAEFEETCIKTRALTRALQSL
ncbi:MAG: aminodeoxychorismate synthase component I [Bacteroidota bacterium]